MRKNHSKPRRLDPRRRHAPVSSFFHRATRMNWRWLEILEERRLLSAALVKDINPTVDNANPSALVEINGTVFFRADDGVHGAELWKTDGTAAGTMMVSDIVAGAEGSFPNWLTNVNGTLYFSASTAATGVELWKSDGTAGGTVMVKNIWQGANSSNPSNLIDVNGTLFFQANNGNGINGYELWKSDGTEAGTVLVKDIYAGIGHSLPSQMTNVNGTLFFYASDGIHGAELWKSDGTESGTVMVKDIYVGGTGDSFLRYMKNVNGTLFFVAKDAVNGVEVHGFELWKSDGTDAGTVMVKDIYAGPGNGYPQNLTNVNGMLFFAAYGPTTGYELWKSDGTETGTVTVKEIFPGGSAGIVNPQTLTNVNGTLFFQASNGASGYELWKSDGTSGGTLLVKDILPGSASGNPLNLTDVNGTLFFTATGPGTGSELWKSDGTAGGTVLVKDIRPGSGNADVQYLTAVNGALLCFSANDGTTGVELWKSDGTPEGTIQIMDINPGTRTSGPSALADINGTLFFAANDGTAGNELWKSDGTAGGTVLVGDLRGGSNPSDPRHITNLNGTAIFAARVDSGYRKLLKSDGTAVGTSVLHANADSANVLLPGAYSAASDQFTTVNGTLYFVDGHTIEPYELWKTDGTPEGTVLVKSLPHAALQGYPDDLEEMNGLLYFTNTAPDVSSGIRRSLWRSDGTEAGTYMIYEGTGAWTGDLTNVNGTLFFRSRHTLWKSDGTAAGTVAVDEVGEIPTDPSQLTNVNGTLYFAADSATGREIWRSDGSAEGTFLIKDIVAGPNSSGPTSLVNVDGTLYFIADDGVSGYELWKSDGTAQGTVRVKDIAPGAVASNPLKLLAMGSYVYFTADDGANGRELWRSDGTEAGTVLVDDINRGPAGSDADWLTNFKGSLFFSANTVDYGLELWKVDKLAPTTRGIADLLVQDTHPSAAVDLWAAFTDAVPDTALTYTVTGISNPALYESIAIDPLTGQLLLELDTAQLGNADLTVRATDAGGLWVETTFNVRLNHAPVLVTPFEDVTVNQDAGYRPITIWDGQTYFNFVDPDGPYNWFGLRFASSDPGLVWAENWNNTLLLRFATDRSGTAQVTVTADDWGGGIATTSFDVTVLPDFTVTPATPEIMVAPVAVNGHNWSPVTAMDARGNFVVVWADQTDGIDINARLYNADGNPISGVISAKTNRSSDGWWSIKPSVAMDADGDFVVTWASYGQDGSGWGVFARRYNAAGVALDAQEFLVNQTTDGDQQNSAVVMDGAGNFTLVWQGASVGGDDIFARRYAASGQAISDEFTVNTLLDNSQQYPVAAMNSAGELVVAWNGDGVRARRFDAQGQPLGTELQANTSTIPMSGLLSTGIDGAGGYVVTWSAINPSGGSDWSNVFARRFDSASLPIAPEFQVNDYPYSGQIHFSTAMADSGEFVVTFMESPTYSWETFAKRFDTNGQPLGPQFMVGTLTSQQLLDSPAYPLQKYVPAVAIARNGGAFVVAWHTYLRTEPYGDPAFFRLYQLNQPPTTSGIANILVNEDAPQTSIDLWAAFADDLDADSALTYSVQANSNPALFSSAQIDPTTGRLLLNYPANVFGHSALTLRATDTGGLFVETSFTVAVNPVNDAPVVSALTLDRTAIDEGQSVNLTGRITDVDAGDSHTLTIDWGDGTSSDNVAFDSVTGLFSVTRLYVDDNPTATPADDDLIRAVATDADGLSGEATATVNVANLAPVATITGPQVGSVIAVGTPTLLTGSFFDPGLLDTHTAIWRITSLSSPTPIEVAATVNELTGGVSANYTFSEAGIYHLQLVVADDDGGSGSASTVAGEDAYIVVYDTSAGFVTGGGWLQTDAGDYAEGFAGGGRVSFAFVTKYLPGASVPSGNFLIKFAGLTLKSNNFNWLIVSGERAQFQGTGVIDGLGTFGFRVSVFDGDTSGDRIRIEIWNLVTGLTLFDTQWGDDLDADIQTLLGGGSVQIHQT